MTTTNATTATIHATVTDRQRGLLFAAIEVQIAKCRSELDRLARLNEVSLSTNARVNARNRCNDRLADYVDLFHTLENGLKLE